MMQNACSCSCSLRSSGRSGLGLATLLTPQCDDNANQRKSDTITALLCTDTPCNYKVSYSCTTQAPMQVILNEDTV